jgi:hypothetical protein
MTKKDVAILTKRPITTITLSPQRAAQLRAIAKARGVTMGELLGRFVRSEIDAGVIPDTIEGFRIEVANKMVEFEFGRTTLRLGREDAIEIADCLDDVASYDRGWREVSVPGRRIL